MSGVEGKIIDCDGHVAEPFELYVEYCEPEFREAAPRRTERDGKRFVVFDGEEHPNFVRYGGRPLGMEDDAQIPRPVQKGPISNGGVDPKVRLKDMAVEGIDFAVLYPSGATSLCAITNGPLESAMYRAYNRWLSEYCSPNPKQLKGNVLVALRHPELAVQEIHRVAEEEWVCGILVPPHMDDFNLDHPHLDPIWQAASEYDLPICIHAGAGRPPYAIGTNESSSNLFLMHSMAHPFEQMRAIASVMGGGVLDRFPKLRFGFIESGIGWVPFWLDRLLEHAQNLPDHVPLMKRRPKEYLADGQIFISCLPEEECVESSIALMGDDNVLFASDYPHWDCGFPETVKRMTRRQLSDDTLRKIFWDNAVRFHTRFGS